MKQLPKFYKAIKEAPYLDFSPKYWQEAKNAFEKKEYFLSAINLLHYLNEDFLKKKKCKKSCSFEAVHTNVKLKVKIENGYFRARLNFLRVDENTNKIALYRRISELNFKDLSFVRYELEGDLIFIEINEPLELLHPYKLYEILRDMVYASSYYKTHFIKEYGAKDLGEVSLSFLNDKEFEKAKKAINAIIQETKKSLDHLVQENLQKYEWDFLAIALMQLNIMPYIRGNIKYKLTEALGKLFSSSIEYEKRIQEAIAFLNYLEKLDEKELKESLYYPKFFLPPKRYFNNAILKELLQDEGESVNKYVKKEDYIGLGFYLYGFFLDLIDRYNLPPKVQNKIVATLVAINKDEMKDAGKRLYEFYEKLLNEEERESDFSFLYILLLIALLYLLSRL